MKNTYLDANVSMINMLLEALFVGSPIITMMTLILLAEKTLVNHPRVNSQSL